MPAAPTTAWYFARWNLTAKTSKKHGAEANRPRLWAVSPLEQIDPFAVGAGDAAHGFLAVDLLGAVIGERPPERGAADGEADEAGHAGGGLQPVPHLIVVLTAAEHDAAHAVAPAAAARRHHLNAIL